MFCILSIIVSQTDIKMTMIYSRKGYLSPYVISWVDKDGNVEISSIDGKTLEDLRFYEGYAFDVKKDCYVSYLGEELPIFFK